MISDPPWEYDDSANAGKRGATHKYTVTGIDALCELPIQELAADDCTMFMWATFPMMPEALRLMSAWGFKYKTAAFVWTKTNKLVDTDFMGMGNWTRANAEVCLLGTIGNPKRICASVRQGIRTPIERHSKKPEEARRRIEQLMGKDLRKLELFARETAPGWSVWGNGVVSTVSMNQKPPTRLRED